MGAQDVQITAAQWSTLQDYVSAFTLQFQVLVTILAGLFVAQVATLFFVVLGATRRSAGS